MDQTFSTDTDMPVREVWKRCRKRVRKADRSDELPADPEQRLIHELVLLRRSIDRNTLAVQSVRRRFFFGLVNGFGAVIGATILVSIVLWILRPFSNTWFLGPFVKSVIHEVEDRPLGSGGAKAR